MKSIIKSIRVVSNTFLDEFRRIYTDTGALLILVGAAIIYPVAYSIAYQNNVLQEIPIGIVDLDNTSTSQQLTKMLDDSEKLAFYHSYQSMEEAKQDFWNSNINGIILIDENFESSIIKGEQVALSLYSDAACFLIYKETLSGALLSTSTFSAGVEIKKLMAQGKSQVNAIQRVRPLNTKFINLYNPSGSYGSYIMPGMLFIILQQTLLIGIGMVNGADRERRNNKMVFPGMMRQRGTVSVVVGKSLAYLLISVFSFSFALVWVYDWFSYPSKASFIETLALIVPYILSTIFLGLSISLLFRKREHSIMMLVFLSPIVLFISGISWPVEFMPKALHTLAYIFPSTNIAPAYLRLRTMGVSLSEISSELSFLLVQTLVYFVIAVVSYKYATRKQLKRIQAESDTMA